jgi:GDP-4-dehydro-6-deoxy-D-mannose reductase
VADVVRAYALLLTQGKNGEIYNVCSGVERSVRSLLARLLELTGVKADVVIDSLRARPSEQARVWGSHEKLSQHTGWKPSVPLDESLLSLYSYWKEKIDN